MAAFASPGAELVQIGPITLRWYGLAIALATIVGLLLSQRLAVRRGIDPNLMGDLVIWLIVGAIPMARIYYVLFRWDYYSQHLNEVVSIWQGGIAIHGAILGGAIATIVFAKLHKLSFWQLGDTVMPCLSLGQAIGRWGNFFNSEAFGAPTNLPWKLYIPPSNRPPGLANYEYFHPTFLYESLWNLGTFAVLLTLFYRWPKAKPGTLMCIYAIAYSAGRVWIEGLRTDSLMLGPLRMAQVVSLSLLALGAFGLFWLYGLKRNFADVAAPVQPQS
jgi:phosphatidylglycerol:prolipoprotein diacylglycerol transferase